MCSGAGTMQLYYVLFIRCLVQCTIVYSTIYGIPHATLTYRRTPNIQKFKSFHHQKRSELVAQIVRNLYTTPNIYSIVKKTYGYNSKTRPRWSRPKMVERILSPKKMDGPTNVDKKANQSELVYTVGVNKLSNLLGQALFTGSVLSLVGSSEFEEGTSLGPVESGRII